MLKRRSNLTLRLGAPLLVLLRPRSLAAYMPETNLCASAALAVSPNIVESAYMSTLCSVER